jgi:hypothetical protein
VASDRRVAKLRERRDVLLSLRIGWMRWTPSIREAAGLNNQHVNVTLGHLRKLRTDGLAHSNGHGWTLTWPAGYAAVELMLLSLGDPLGEAGSRGE